jgi:hypothetical protein
MGHPIFQLSVSDLNFSELKNRMLRQLDAAEWKLAGGNNEVKVYHHPKIENGIDGFKTVVECNTSINVMTEYLGKNICLAMQEMNHLYHSGETLKLINDDAYDNYNAIVRTNFKMPFPFTNREFLHYLKVMRIDNNTVIILYHSTNDHAIPDVKEGFLRCPTYLSGQRITSLANQKVRVEHMMVYELYGNVSPKIQNLLFKKGHVKAYTQEWQNLVNRFKS